MNCKESADGVEVTREPLPDLILRLHREGHTEDQIAAELAAAGRDSEADAAGICIDVVIAEASDGVNVGQGGDDAHR